MAMMDVERLPIEGRFDGRQAIELIKRHSLGSASVGGTYTLNARLRATQAGR